LAGPAFAQPDTVPQLWILGLVFPTTQDLIGLP
jgi:hypothetical protein